MKNLHVTGFLGLAAIFSLIMGVALAERSVAQTMVEITAADLTSDTTGAESERKTAQQKVNKKIADATLTGGSVVSFPSGEFKDVGEIQVFGKSGTAPSEEPPVAAKPITFRGDGTVFTGKITINVFNSKYIEIEGFTFRDTQVPDTVTLASGGGLTAGTTVGNTDATRGEDTGVVWLNTAVAAVDAACSTKETAVKTLAGITVRDNVFMNTARHGVLARAKRAPLNLDPDTNYDRCDSSAVTVSGNSFVGIGLGPNAVYLDSAKTVPGTRNRESAIEGDRTYGWTVTDNVIGVTADGEDAKGTTANGIRLNHAFGKTAVSNNTVNNTAWSGIVVGGNGSTGAAGADNAEITIANNKVTNSRNDPYFVSEFENRENTGYDNSRNRYAPAISRQTRGRIIFHPEHNAGLFPTMRALDEFTKVAVVKLPSGYTQPWLGDGDPPSRLLASIVPYTGSPQFWRQVYGLVPGTQTARRRSQLPASGAQDGIPRTATLRWLRLGLEAGVELNRLTSEKVTVENNELTNNVVGLAVCPSAYCYAESPFYNIAPAAETLTTTDSLKLKVPTVRSNSIYDNRKATDMPSRFARVDVVNALPETSTGTGKTTLVLAGNYLGDSPGVEGDVDTDDLASATPENAGPQETDDPGVAATGGATLSGTAITLTYDEALDEESVPAAAAFTVMETDSGGLSRSVTVSGVAVSGMSVTLTLANAPGSGNSVTVSYDPLRAGSGGPIRDLAGNEAPALTSRMLTAPGPTDPVDPDSMGPGEPQQPGAGGGDGDGGCALASGGGDGTDLGRLLPLMLAMFVFGLRRNGNVKKKI